MKIHALLARASFITAALLLCAYAPVASAALVEGFESLSLSASNSIGDASVQSPNYFGIAPTEGTHELLLTSISTAGAHDSISPQSGNNAASVSSVATFLGVTTAQIRNTKAGAPVNATGQEGSAFKLSLGFLAAGSTVTLDYNFLTADMSQRDFAFYTLTGLAGNTPTFADTLDAGVASPSVVPPNPFNLQSGFHTLTINITTAGTYTLGLGIMDALTTDGPSALLIDNIATNAAPIPEPSSIALAVAGATLLLSLRKRESA